MQMMLLPPYHRNFGKLIRKSPKLHVIDPGLASWKHRASSPAGPTAPAHSAAGLAAASHLRGHGEGEICRTLLVMRTAASEIVVVESFTGGHLPQERIRQGDDRRQLVRVTDHRESLRPIRQRQRVRQTALAGLVDDYQVE